MFNLTPKTLTGTKKMRKERRHGTCYMKSERTEKFINEASALLAAQTMQTLLFTRGFVTTSNFSKFPKKMEVSVIFKNELPLVPKAYIASAKEISSHEYYDDYSMKVCRIRVITYYFTY